MILYRVLLGDIYGHLTATQIKDILFFPEIPYHRLDFGGRDNRTHLFV